MTFDDVKLLVKKILIGAVVTAIPFLIIFGGLQYVKSSLSRKAVEHQQSDKTKIQKGER